MLIYIVWQENQDRELDSHIIRIYKDKEKALKKCNRHNNTIIKNIAVDDNGFLGDFYSYKNDNDYHCTKMKVPDGTNKMHFIKIHEFNGGGSYHSISSIYAYPDIKDMFQTAIDYFNTEHNRDDECEDCKNNGCKKKLMKELKENSRSFFHCTNCEEVTIEIWSMEI